jgi:hypothetical protein
VCNPQYSARIRGNTAETLNCLCQQ